MNQIEIIPQHLLQCGTLRLEGQFFHVFYLDDANACHEANT